MPESNANVSYCVNQYCEHRENIGDELTHCKNCGGKLLVGDRYRLIKRLDKQIQKGYTAKWVFEAEDIQNKNNRVVVKLVDNTRLDWIHYLKREHDFLQIAPQPFYRVKAEDYIIWDPSPTESHFRLYCLVVPKVEGIDTDSWVKENGPIDELRCMEWLFGLLPYLEAFSELPAIYRDLTPSNVMVNSDDEIKLIDFGSVKLIDKEYLTILDSNLPNKDGTDIMRGTRIFTPAFAPKEQLFGQSVPQSDFFSLGRTITYWMTGANPIDLWQNGGIDLAKYRPDLTKTFIQFVEWLTQDEPGARPSSAKTLRYYLEETYVFLVEAEEEKNYLDNKVRDYLRKLYRKSGLLSLMVISVVGVLGWFVTSQFWYRQGLKSLDTGDYERAAQELTQASAINPFLRDALVQKGFACIGFNDYGCAEEVYQNLLQNDPNNSLYLYQLGFILEKTDRIDESRNYYRRSIKIQPIQLESYLRLSRIAIEAEDYYSAQKYLTQAEENYASYPAKRQPNDATLLNYYQGWLALEKNEYGVAQTRLNTALESLTAGDLNSLATGDIYCLLAISETAKRVDQATLLGTWSGCFSSVTRTQEGKRIRDQKIQSAIKTLLK